ncbi:phage minor capsid protein [Paenibacillus cisolokensis]|uniref:phage minor capsid protein n=1 Tax=Paenibacillus cisolokensis TaxID=1658519 RepID=UPI003D2AA9E2
MAKDPYSLREVFEEMALNLIASLKRNLSRHEREQERVGFKFDQWQLAKLRALQRFRNENRKIISAAGSEADKLIDDVVQESFRSGQNRVQRLWDKVVDTVLKPFGRRRAEVPGEVIFPKDFRPPPVQPRPTPTSGSQHPAPRTELPQAPPENDFFHMNEKKLRALQDAAKKDLKDGRQAALRKMDDVYRQVIFKAEAHMASGALTLDQAIDKATKDFLERGLDVIEYGDGRRMTISAYAEMALRTVSQRATFLGEGKKRDEWGVYTVLMSSHDNCSPWCLPFQGTIMIDDVYTSISREQAQQLSRDTGYLLLSYAIEQGAFHPNCRHTLATFFPGISRLPEQADPKLALERYRAEQWQRYLERGIRKYKRLEVGSLDEANQAKYGKKVLEWQDRLKQHLEANPSLRRDNRRDRIDGELPPSERRQLLKNAELNAKIEETRNFIRSDEQLKHLHMGHQGKHIKGHNNYIEGKSYLTISADEAQELVNRYAGSGEVRFTRKGEWNNKEIILTDDQIGVYVDQVTGQELEPDGFTIHYGKKGTHIVPYRRERK